MSMTTPKLFSSFSSDRMDRIPDRFEVRVEDAHNIPESARALCRMVSFTAANTRRMLEVSVACVRLCHQHQRSSNKTTTVTLGLTEDRG